MTRKILHSYIAQAAKISIERGAESTTVSVSASGSLPIRFPGRLIISTSATYQVRMRIDDPKIGTGKPFQTQTRTLLLSAQIRTPDGILFTSDHITIDDLNKFRDLRGTSHGNWTFHVHGESKPIVTDDSRDTEVMSGKGRIVIQVEETLSSLSAKPLINISLSANSRRTHSFDLYRVGTFTATTRSANPIFGISARKMKLFDPDGVAVATNDNGRLTFPVGLATLEKSRNAAGLPRLWSLEIFQATGPLTDGTSKVLATVVESARINIDFLQRRIDKLIGLNGRNLSIFCERKGSTLFARLVIKDAFSAETIDMHGLLDSVIQDAGVNHDIEVNKTYTIFKRGAGLGRGLKVSDFNFRIDNIDIAIGASKEIQPSIPALKLNVGIQGHATVEVKGFPLATVKIRDNRIKMETGLKRNADGSFAAVNWIEDNRLDVDLHWKAAVVAGVITGGFGLLGAGVAAEIIEEYFTTTMTESVTALIIGAMEKVPQVLAIVLGGEFTYRSLRLEGDNIVFDYIAPVESEPKPATNHSYTGVIGRSILQQGQDLIRLIPPSLGDTWRVDNLKKNIQHIVVVTMENRSFDHVLGYRAQLPEGHDSNGLTTELTNFLASRGFPVRRLKLSGIIPNGRGLKTKFPLTVGIALSDVLQQLGTPILSPSGLNINSPEGFVRNFAKEQRLPRPGTPIIKEDILGYYEGDDLPFFEFLVKNYSYCEKYFCSHPGPTFPNRMFSLTGDLQYDRTGEAIPDNSTGDNFFLSRAMTIFDLLSRKRVGWRVYESFPSLTMLRMFARYATDNTNIIDFTRFNEDVVRGDLPAVTFIDPAMNHFPKNDDHPPADMYRGQLFLKEVYDTLRSNEELWLKTMLIITYDEHGGFYDHVIPPVADILMRPTMATPGDGGGTAPFTPSSLSIPYGVRVPTFVVSPWSGAGKGPDITLDHCSILKTIIARFCGEGKPFVSARVNASRTFDSYVTEATPRLNVPNSPAMPALPDKPGSIVAGPVSRKQMREGKVDYHELSGMLARILGR